MAIQIRQPTIINVGLAFGVGAVTAAVWAAFTKRNIEATYRSGAEDLRAELERRGSGLRDEISRLAADSAVEALRDELADFGITAGMLADLRTAVEAAEAVRAGARRRGESVDRFLRTIRG